MDQTKAQTDAYGATLDALGVSQGFAAKSAKAEPWRKLGSEFEELGEELGKHLIPFVAVADREAHHRGQVGE